MAFDSGSMDGNRNGEAEVASAPANAIQFGELLFVIASMALAVACVVLALQYFVAERLPDLTEAALQAATERWDATWTGELRHGCRDSRGTARHRSRRSAGQASDGGDSRRPDSAATYVGHVVGARHVRYAQPGYGRRLRIRSKMIQAAPGTKWRLRCEFDPKLGIPLRYHRLVTGGPEVYWRGDAVFSRK